TASRAAVSHDRRPRSTRPPRLPPRAGHHASEPVAGGRGRTAGGGRRGAPGTEQLPPREGGPRRVLPIHQLLGRAAAAEGSWASGPTPDGKGEFSYVAEPQSGVPMPPPTHPDARFYGTTEIPNTVEKIAGRAQDAM